MSILIKGMAMPKNCGECPFASPTRDGLKCDAVNYLAKCLAHPVSRMSYCPLIELPPHGRLIDIDDIDSIVMDIRVTNQTGLTVKLAAPTIIEAKIKE